MEQEGTASQLGDPKDKLILIVDDDESILDLLEHVVKKEGFKVERAIDGTEAVRKAKALKPNLLVLDFMLPGIGGFEVLKQLQSEDTGTIAILVITGRHMQRQTVDMIKQEPNVRDFIEKPIRPAVFSGTLHRILKTRPPESSRPMDRGPLSGGW